MATCKQLQEDYNRLAGWFATHGSLKGKPEYDGAIDKEINIIKDAQRKGCAWIAAAARKRSGSKTGGGLKKQGKSKRTKK